MFLWRLFSAEIFQNHFTHYSVEISTQTLQQLPGKPKVKRKFVSDKKIRLSKKNSFILIKFQTFKSGATVERSATFPAWLRAPREICPWALVNCTNFIPEDANRFEMSFCIENRDNISQSRLKNQVWGKIIGDIPPSYDLTKQKIKPNSNEDFIL